MLMVGVQSNSNNKLSNSIELNGDHSATAADSHFAVIEFLFHSDDINKLIHWKNSYFLKRFRNVLLIFSQNDTDYKSFYVLI